jgi:NAD(P)-dependent dehydrogenase (short-subunit alcohol dehydrogenase family)
MTFIYYPAIFKQREASSPPDRISTEPNQRFVDCNASSKTIMDDRYAAAHENRNGPGDARPTAAQVIEDQRLTGKLDGRVILITGGTAGLGTESARVLQKNGAKVFITARTFEKGQKVASELNKANPDSPAIEVVVINLSSLQSVRDGAKDFLARSDKLNVLLNNAGVMACPESKTADGFEMQFGVNHIAHFLLFQFLEPLLLASSTPKLNSRVVSLSSSGHRISDVHFDNYNLAGEYDPWVAYGQSKTANILFANELDRRYGSRGLHGLSVHPGVIMNTELSRHKLDASNETMEGMLSDPRFASIEKSAEQGAATQVWAAVGGDLERKGGLFLDKVAVAQEAKLDVPVFESGYLPRIYDGERASRLWGDSLRFVDSQEDA